MNMFADRLKILREKEGLQQKEMAVKLKLPNTTYHNYESGRTEPDFNTVVFIANYFDVTTDYLLGKTDHPKTVVTYEIPRELKEIGIEYLIVARKFKDKKIPPDHVDRIIAAIEAYNNNDDKS